MTALADHVRDVTLISATLWDASPLPAVQPPSDDNIQQIVWDRIVRKDVRPMLEASDLEAFWQSIDEAWASGLMVRAAALAELSAGTRREGADLEAALVELGERYGGVIWGEASGDAARLLAWTRSLVNDLIAQRPLSDDEREVVLMGAGWLMRLAGAYLCLNALADGAEPGHRDAPALVLRALQLAPRKAFAAVRSVQIARQAEEESELPLVDPPDALTARLVAESDRFDRAAARPHRH